MRIHAQLSLIISVCFVVSAIAQTDAQDSVTYGSTPEEVCEMSFATVRTKGMDKVIQYIHPDELKRFQMMIWPVLERAADDTTRDLLNLLDFFGYSAGLPNPDDVDTRAFMQNIFSVYDKVVPEFGKALQNMENQTLGVVYEGDSLSHVVTRHQISMKEGQFTYTYMEVVSCKKYKDGWSLMLNTEFEMIAQALKLELGN